MRRAALVTAALALLSCRVRPPFTCADGSQCGPGGICIDQACAFPDDACSSGWRFDPSASGRGRQCVTVDDAGVPPSPADLAKPGTDLADDAGGTCAAAAGQPCCPATPEEAAGLPSPPAAPKGQGRCPPSLACAQGQCPAHTTCPDGSYNGDFMTITVVYCVALH